MSQTQRQVNAFNMSWIMLSHPKPASYQLCHFHDLAVTGSAWTIHPFAYKDTSFYGGN